MPYSRMIDAVMNGVIVDYNNWALPMRQACTHLTKETKSQPYNWLVVEPVRNKRADGLVCSSGVPALLLPYLGSFLNRLTSVS